MKKKVSGKTKTSFIVLLLFSFFILNNCQYFTQLSYKEWKESSDVYNDVDVYISGYYNFSGFHPCYWKNGELVTLGSYSADSQVKSIFLDGSDIYCGGYYYNISSQNACYWKNGKQVKVELDNSGTYFSFIYSIAVAGGIVYACGYENNKACYWINGKKYSLNTPIGSTDSYSLSIIVDCDTLDFYIAGYYVYGTYFACYWKNGGECITLSTPYPGNNYRANTIVVSSGKVFIGGYVNSPTQIPCYWIDEKIVELPYNSYGSINSMKVYNGNVYLAGINNNGTSYPSLWKDKSRIWMHNIPGNAYGADLFYNDIYITGGNGVSLYCWKNGNPSLLPYTGGSGAANCIVVKPKR